ncbi:MAG: phosphoribosylformylglycinamidine cyclo-ligase [Alphaproteobacteria bacterium]|nr:phosphoribosylformylglycinamidine cyclo-ligase [Alphaproteobacteria bacterium]
MEEKKQDAYARAGVDIEAGNQLVEAIKPLARATARAGADGALGGFGGLFDLKAAGFRDPILVSATDGVGTKIKLALQMDKHDGIGIDLVAMVVNDLIAVGAEPLFFLDYYATGQLNTETARTVVAGIAEGCKVAHCALIGGETAEMPGMYAQEDYDLAGFAVGAVERGQTLPRQDIKEGDIVLGLASNGLHSNGFSLVRKIIEQMGMDLNTPAPFDGSRSLGQALLEPTRIYVQPVLGAVKTGKVKALAHITGGGLLENIPRILPKGLGVWLSTKSWPVPAVFKWLAKEASISAKDMARTFNCGLGMIVITAAEDAEELMRFFTDVGETIYRVGEVEKNLGDNRISLQGMESSWPC